MNPILFIPAEALMLAGVAIYPGARRQECAGRALQGLADIRALCELLERLPQHRGLANAVLQGNDGFRAELTQVQAAVDAGMALVRRLAQGEDRWRVAERCQAMDRAWSRLKAELDSLAAEESFRRHTELIRELLYLMEDVGEASGLLSQGREGDDLARILVVALPQVCEALGQARGIGTGVAARGQCDTVSRVRLRYLLDKAERVSRSYQAYLGNLSGEAARLAQTASESTRRFLDLLRMDLLETQTIRVAPEAFFAQGTEAIRHDFTLLDHLGSMLQARLEREARSVRRRVVWRRTASLTLQAGALALAAAGV